MLKGADPDYLEQIQVRQDAKFDAFRGLVESIIGKLRNRSVSEGTIERLASILGTCAMEDVRQRNCPMRRRPVSSRSFERSDARLMIDSAERIAMSPSYTDYIIPNFKCSLSAHPDVSQRIGIYIGTFSRLEFCLSSLFGLLTNMNDAGARVVLNQFRNVSDRICVVKDLAAGLEGRAPSAGAVRSLCEQAIEANRFRNMVAHSIYAESRDRKHLYCIMNAARKGAKPKAVPITAKILDANIAKIESWLQVAEALLSSAR